MSMKKFSTRTESFTLIEMLIVIAIIGLLASLIIINLASSAMKARDAKRKADLATIHSVLSLYYDAHGEYPVAGTCGYNTNCYVFSTGGPAWIPALVPTYTSALPVDPINSGGPPWVAGGYEYAYGNVLTVNGQQGQTYDLTAQLENPNDPERCGVKNWKWYYPPQSWCTAFGGSYSNQIYEDSPYSGGQ